jgi:hypothetical protein
LANQIIDRGLRAGTAAMLDDFCLSPAGVCMLKLLYPEGMFDPASDLLTRDLFWHDLPKIMVNASHDATLYS